MAQVTKLSPVESSNPEVWLDEHGDHLFAYALRRVRDPDVAEELVQEALVAGITSRDSFAASSSIRTWLVGILKHKILQDFRRRSRHRGNVDLEALTQAAIDAQFTKRGHWKTVPEPWASDPSGAPQREELVAVLRRCLSKLPPRIAEAFLLVERQEVSAEKLGVILQTSTSNVYVMLYRARSGLRLCLERNWFGHDAPDRG